MSFPYIIWTMQRTGGTTLAALLAMLSEYPGVQHEPFNSERIFGHVTKGWAATRDIDDLHALLAQALTNTPVIKHCYELVPPPVNEALMQVASELGYRHIVLDRRAEVDRILSLELAKITGAWGRDDARRAYRKIEEGAATLQPVNLPRALAHMKACADRRVALEALFAAQNQPSFTVFFEDVYGDASEGRALIERLLAFLEINPADHENYDALVVEALTKKAQNSARIADSVPNFAQARAQLEALLSQLNSKTAPAASGVATK